MELFGAFKGLEIRDDLLTSKARKAFTAGEPRTMRNVRKGRRDKRMASSGVLEPIVARMVGVRPSSTPAGPKFALVYHPVISTNF